MADYVYEPCDNCLLLPICLGKTNMNLIRQCKIIRDYIADKTDMFNPDLHPNKEGFSLLLNCKYPIIEKEYRVHSLNKTFTVSRYPISDSRGVRLIYFKTNDGSDYTVTTVRRD
jgi:hypothetical protein